MELISTVFMIAFWAFMIAMLVGLFEPKLVLKGFLQENDQPTAGKAIALYSMFGFMAVIGWWFFSPSKDNSSELVEKQIQEEQQAKNEKKYHLVFAGQETLKKIARDPDSLVFERVRYMDDESVCYEYRAKNGFGGMSKGKAVLSNKGFITNDTNGFQSIWSEKCDGKTGEEISL